MPGPRNVFPTQEGTGKTGGAGLPPVLGTPEAQVAAQEAILHLRLEGARLRGILRACRLDASPDVALPEGWYANQDEDNPEDSILWGTTAEGLYGISRTMQGAIRSAAFEASEGRELHLDAQERRARLGLLIHECLQQVYKQIPPCTCAKSRPVLRQLALVVCAECGGLTSFPGIQSPPPCPKCPNKDYILSDDKGDWCCCDCGHRWPKEET